MWHHTVTGSGRPLVLLHGLGMSHAAWRPVMPLLSPHRSVVAFDIAGFGSTPPLSGHAPTIANLVCGLQTSLHAMGLREPVDVAGNSLGGTMALEAARRGIARQAVAISPAGLWTSGPPPHVRYVFGGLRFAATHATTAVRSAMRFALLRELALAIPVSAGSRRMPAVDAERAIDDLAGAAAFEATFEHSRAPFSGTAIAVPVTIAFGDRDWILTPSARRHEAVPADAVWLDKRGWGHVPMWVDPEGVARLILNGTSRFEP